MEPKVGEQLCSWWAQVSAAERESTSESARSTTGDVGNASSCCASVGFVFTFSLSLSCLHYHRQLNGEVFSCSWTTIELSSWTTAGRVGCQTRNAARNVSRVESSWIVSRRRRRRVSRVSEAADDACFWRRYFVRSPRSLHADGHTYIHVCANASETNKNKAQSAVANRRQSEI